MLTHKNFKLDENREIEILNNLQVGIFCVNFEGQIIYWNSEAERITGFTPKDILGKSCMILEGDRCLRNECSADISDCRLLKQDTIHNIECGILIKGGNRIIIQKSGKLIRDKNGDPLYTVESFSDITLAKKGEEQYHFNQSKNNNFFGIIGSSPKMLEVFTNVKLASGNNATVLITGENGTGKDLVAKVIHNLSERKSAPYVKLNCSAIPDTLIESELFGYRKGAFSGATSNKKGLFEQANGGTVFLDEIGELRPEIQVKLLRVIQEREFIPLGGNKTIKVDIRLIAATNRDIQALVKSKLFREDLYYRLNVFNIHIPPLRERKEDIPLLILHFINFFNKEHKKNIEGISRNAINILLRNEWKGNVRELENTINFGIILSTGKKLTAFDLPQEYFPKYKSGNLQNSSQSPNLAISGNSEKKRILDTLNSHNWNRSKTAKALGISRVTLWKKIKKYNILVN